MLEKALRCIKPPFARVWFSFVTHFMKSIPEDPYKANALSKKKSHNSYLYCATPLNNIGPSLKSRKYGQTM